MKSFNERLAEMVIDMANEEEPMTKFCPILSFGSELDCSEFIKLARAVKHTAMCCGKKATFSLKQNFEFGDFSAEIRIDQ